MTQTHDVDFSSLQPVTLTPVGIVRSDIKEPILKGSSEGLSLEARKEKIKAHREQVKNQICDIIIHPELTDILDGIEGFSHILVLYWPHLTPPLAADVLKVHPMGRKDIPKQGIFATCSPSRPNPVLITAVKLAQRENNVLKVQGFEAVDGSPVLDIKPYNPGYYRIDEPGLPEWMQRIRAEE